MISGGSRSGPATSGGAASTTQGGSGMAAADLAAAHEKSKDELQSRLSKSPK
jgi:hypothetical protein